MYVCSVVPMYGDVCCLSIFCTSPLNSAHTSPYIGIQPHHVHTSPYIVQYIFIHRCNGQTGLHGWPMDLAMYGDVLWRCMTTDKAPPRCSDVLCSRCMSRCMSRPMVRLKSYIAMYVTMYVATHGAVGVFLSRCMHVYAMYGMCTVRGMYVIYGDVWRCMHIRDVWRCMVDTWTLEVQNARCFVFFHARSHNRHACAGYEP